MKFISEYHETQTSIMREYYYCKKQKCKIKKYMKLYS